jgi:ribosomal-protein-alanine N-acetyltransferase
MDGPAQYRGLCGDLRIMSDIPNLITARLILRALRPADSDAIQRVFPHWEILKFMGATIPWPYPEDGASSYVQNIAIPAMREGREWHWTIRPLNQPNLLIGMISLMDQPDDNRGFWLNPDWQGQGLMSEACQIVTHSGSRPWKSRCCACPRRLPTPAPGAFPNEAACGSYGPAIGIMSPAVIRRNCGN